MNNTETLALQSVFCNTSASTSPDPLIQWKGGKKGKLSAREWENKLFFPLRLSPSFRLDSKLELGNTIINKLKKALYTIFQLSAREHILQKLCNRRIFKEALPAPALERWLECFEYLTSR